MGPEGLTLYGYRIVDRLGYDPGSLGWRAIRLSDDRMVAITLILGDNTDDSASLARFDEEWDTLASLNHPCIVRVLEHGETVLGEPWFVTEYTAGVPIYEFVNRLTCAAFADCEDLSPNPHALDGVASGEIRHGFFQRLFRHRTVTRRGAFPLREVLELFVKACDAVGAAHRMGVIHGDLQPSNIIVDDQGTPFVLEFGMAKLFTVQGADDMPVVAALAWAAPEQDGGRPDRIDARTDVYTLGVVFFSLLTGSFPYQRGWPVGETFDQIRSEGLIWYRSPMTLARYYATASSDEDLQSVILKALQYSRHHRYRTAKELGDDLARYLRGERPLARADRGRRSPKKSKPRDNA